MFHLWFLLVRNELHREFEVQLKNFKFWKSVGARPCEILWKETDERKALFFFFIASFGQNDLQSRGTLLQEISFPVVNEELPQKNG